jgi:hypothetical protein
MVKLLSGPRAGRLGHAGARKSGQESIPLRAEITDAAISDRAET